METGEFPRDIPERSHQLDKGRAAWVIVIRLPGALHKVSMVGIAQLVEHRLVVPAVAGSSPVVHPEKTTPDFRVGGCFVLLSGSTSRDR